MDNISESDGKRCEVEGEVEVEVGECGETRRMPRGTIEP